MKKTLLAACLSMTLGAVPASIAHADPFIGEVTYVPYTFCPRFSVPAYGQVMSISQYTSMFALLGLNYGGDGRTTFAVPDLRERFAQSEGTGPGLSPALQGWSSGTSYQTLTSANLPSHTHNYMFSGDAPDTRLVSGNTIGYYVPKQIFAAYNQNTQITMHQEVIGASGGNQSFPVRQPALALLPCIYFDGAWPSRN